MCSTVAIHQSVGIHVTTNQQFILGIQKSFFDYYELIILIGARSNPIEPEEIYDEFDHVRSDHNYHMIDKYYNNDFL